MLTGRHGVRYSAGNEEGDKAGKNFDCRKTSMKGRVMLKYLLFVGLAMHFLGRMSGREFFLAGHCGKEEPKNPAITPVGLSD